MSYLLNYFFPNPTLKPDSVESRGVAPSLCFDGILSLYRYNPPLSTVLHDIKYRYLYSLVCPLAQICADSIKKDYKNILSYWQNNDFILLPVPLHWARRSWRGFNQSELVGQHLTKHLNLRFDTKILRRTVLTRPQVKLDEFSRQVHFLDKNIFTLNTVPAVGNYIIFDDVTTSNSTLNACLKPLLPFCKNKPWALTIAG